MTARSTCSVRSAAGVSITSATVFDGCIHLTAFDHGTDATSATGALYTLPRAAAEQLANIACPTERYTDLDEFAWYHEPVDWAVSEEVMLGTDVDAGIFDPTDTLTRAQMAVVLWRMAGAASADGDLSHFVDGASVSDWAADGVSWAVGEGYLRGIGGISELRPQGGLERAQAATVLMRADRAGFPFPEPAE